MYMSYTNNPCLPKVRGQAVQMVRSGLGIRQVARHFGFSHGAIINWLKRANTDSSVVIPTLSSRPHQHPLALSPEMIQIIVGYRLQYGRCAEVLHHLLSKDSYVVSLSSVKRVLKRQGLIKTSPWKKWHSYPERPRPEKPGILVEVDTIFDGPYTDRLYIYTLLDVCSRWAYAWPTSRINNYLSSDFLQQANRSLPFNILTLQSDHGHEFSKYFTKYVSLSGIKHRHSRVRKPTDNGHVERFNRTIQEECLNRVPKKLILYQKAITEYLHYYNTERPHMGLGMKTPLEVVRSY